MVSPDAIVKLCLGDQLVMSLILETVSLPMQGKVACNDHGGMLGF